MKRNLCRISSILFAFLVIAGPGTANIIENIDKPDERGFIVDLANLISDEAVSYTHLTLPTSDLV